MRRLHASRLRRLTLVATLLALPLGCQTEVPYGDVTAETADTAGEADAVGDGDTEAPAFTAETAPVGDATGPPTEDEFTLAPPEDTPPPDVGDRYAKPANTDPDPAPPPWDVEDSEPEANTPEETAEVAAEDGPPSFFAGLETAEPAEATTDEQPNDASDDQAMPWAPEDGEPASAEAQRLFGALAGTSETAQPQPETPDEQLFEPVTEPVEEVDDEPESGFGSFLDEAYADIVDEPSPSRPAKKPAGRAGSDARPAPKPLAPSPRNADLPSSTLGDASRLLSGMRTPTKKRRTPPKAPTLPPADNEPMPWDLADDGPPIVEPPPQDYPIVEPPASEPTAEAADDSMPWAPDDSAIASEPTDTLPPPAVEADPPRVASLPPTPRPRVPGIPSLPPLRVESDNTRHIAWLLGGKLGLARLADSDGATRQEISAWAGETRELARRLQITPPDATGEGPVPNRVLGLLEECATLADAMAVAYGSDHAALVEIALKTNALLVLHDDRPDLATPVARAVAAAADRAGLPPSLWRETVELLEADPDSRTVRQSVMQLHASVEAYLR